MLRNYVERTNICWKKTKGDGTSASWESDWIKKDLTFTMNSYCTKLYISKLMTKNEVSHVMAKWIKIELGGSKAGSM